MKNPPLATLLALSMLAGVPEVRAIDSSANLPGSTGAVPEVLMLQQAIDEALENGPALRAVDHEASAAHFEAKEASRARWGKLDAQGSYLNLNDDQIVRPISRELLDEGFAGLPFDRNQLHYGLSYQVPLYLGGKLQAGIHAAKLEAQRAGELLTGTTWQITFNVASLYATAQALREVIRATDDQIASLDTTEQRLELMVREGKRPDVDRLKVVEELEGARAERASVEADRVEAISLLLSMLGRDPSEPVKLEPLQDRPPVLVKTRDEIRQSALRASPIRSADLAEQKARSGVKVARSDFLPSFSAWGNAMRHDAPSLDSALDTWELGVGVKLPLFAGGGRNARLAAAREEQRAAEAKLDRVRLDLAAKVEEGLARFDASLSEVKATRARVAAAAEAARIEQIRYETGASTVEDLLRARARQRQSEAAQARAMAGALVAGRRLDTLAESEVAR